MYMMYGRYFIVIYIPRTGLFLETLLYVFTFYRSAADLADCLRSLSACERCIKECREESCGKHSLSVPCKDCAENGVVCVSFAVFNILWDMGKSKNALDSYPLNMSFKC